MLPDSNEEDSGKQAVDAQSYRCLAEGCDLNWERRLGYFKTTTVNRTFQFGIGGKRCPFFDHGFLYVSGSLSGNRLWNCPVEDCGYHEVERDFDQNQKR